VSRQRLLYLDAACSFQVAYALLDIFGQILGTVRPWELARLADPPRGAALPFRSLECALAGVPATVRIHHQLNPADPDGDTHLLHRITVGTEGGNLTLVATHGPTVWSPRPEFPHAIRGADSGNANFFAAGSASAQRQPWDPLDLPSGQVLGPADASSYREIFWSVWPAGVARALSTVHDAILEGEKPTRLGQYHLMLSLLWQDIAGRLGSPKLITSGRGNPLSTSDLTAVTAAWDREGSL
jgi:thiazolinyl imide reductase